MSTGVFQRNQKARPDPLGVRVWDVEFVGTLAETDVAAITADASGLSGSVGTLHGFVDRRLLHLDDWAWCSSLSAWE